MRTVVSTRTIWQLGIAGLGSGRNTGAVVHMGIGTMAESLPIVDDALYSV